MNNLHLYIKKMVGPTGFEPATPSPPAKCATRLRYGPTLKRTEIRISVVPRQVLYGDTEIFRRMNAWSDCDKAWLRL